MKNIPEGKIKEQYSRLRNRTFWGVTAAYSLFYLCRLSMGVVKKPLIDEGLFTASELGIIASAFYFVYAIGKFLNGFIADYCNARRFMATGLIFSSVINLLMGAIGLAGGYVDIPGWMMLTVFVALWGFNGWVLSMGSPSGIVSLSRWFPQSRRGTFYSIFCSTPYIGEALSMAVTGSIVAAFGWEYGFLVSAMGGFVGVGIILSAVSDTPQSKGLPSIQEISGEEVRKVDKLPTKEIQKMVLRNPAIWIIAISCALINLTKYGLMEWGVLYLQGARGFSLENSSWIIGFSAVFAILGTVGAGWLSDVVFKGNRTRPALLSGFVALVSLALFLFASGSRVTMAIYVSVFSLAVGVLYCVVSGLMAIDIVPRKATGAALGVVGISSYMTIGLQNIVSGLLIDRYSESVVKVVDGVEQVVTEYDFVPVAVFWLSAVLISFIVPVLCHPERTSCHPERTSCHPERSEGSPNKETNINNKKNMKLTITVEYKTAWGEELVLSLGEKKHPMTYVSDGLWKLELPKFSVAKPVEYKYEVVRDGALVRSEWGVHTLALKNVSAKVLVVNDRWQDRPADAPFFSSAFTKGIFGRGKSSYAPEAGKHNVQFQVAAPTLRPNEVLAFAASTKAFGKWSRVIPFDDSAFPVWTLPLEVTEPFMYKLVIADKETLKPLAWEDGENRVFGFLPLEDEFFVEASVQPRFSGRQWKGAGTAIPVFSLRSEDDFGVGEFLDLKKMVDWAASTGQSVLQLLPINDTTMTGTWEDSYPYNANSTFALHPQFINLPAAGVPVTKAYKELQAELNALPQIDYERVNNAKLELLRKAFDKKFAKLSETKAYQAFMDANSHWLLPYAAFCVLRDMNGTPDFSKWKAHKKYNEKKIAAFCQENKAAVDFWCFVQYHLDAQLSEVCRYAHSKGVVLKGDLPIGISRTSADAWLYPELFHMDSQAGAPPDAFAEDGQNWGFPTYNWEKMAEDDYAWWKARLSKMSEYFDAFRIDHILGFFRIWQIPLWSKSGLDGYFSPALPYPAEELQGHGFDVADSDLFIEDPHQPGYYHPKIGAKKTRSYSILDAYRRGAFDKLYTDFFYYRHNQFWKEKAMQKLPALLDSTGMLACGEDLGMIPATVPQVMSDLRILSLEIQRMPKSVEELFAHPSNYPYLSVCTTSTHDMNPVRAWWEEDREVTQKFWNMLLGNHGAAPAFCEPWICRQILEQHLWSPAMLTVLPLQDWLSMDGALRRENPHDERINVPANPRHYWRYRMHLTLEDLASQQEFNDTLTSMIAASGRK